MHIFFQPRSQGLSKMRDPGNEVDFFRNNTLKVLQKLLLRIFWSFFQPKWYDFPNAKAVLVNFSSVGKPGECGLLRYFELYSALLHDHLSMKTVNQSINQSINQLINKLYLPSNTSPFSYFPKGTCASADSSRTWQDYTRHTNQPMSNKHWGAGPDLEAGEVDRLTGCCCECCHVTCCKACCG